MGQSTHNIGPEHPDFTSFKDSLQEFAAARGINRHGIQSWRYTEGFAARFHYVGIVRAKDVPKGRLGHIYVITETFNRAHKLMQQITQMAITLGSYELWCFAPHRTSQGIPAIGEFMAPMETPVFVAEGASFTRHAMELWTTEGTKPVYPPDRETDTEPLKDAATRLIASKWPTEAQGAPSDNRQVFSARKR